MKHFFAAAALATSSLIAAPVFENKKPSNEDLLKALNTPVKPEETSPAIEEFLEYLMTGDMEAVQGIVTKTKGDAANWKMVNGVRPLMVAITFWQNDVAAYLISQNANIHAKDALGKTVLHYAAQFANAKAVPMLIATGAGAHISERDNDGMTPLIIAAHHGIVPTLQALIDNGAKVDDRDTFKNAIALHIAAFYNHAEAVTFLLARGADSSAKTAQGQTALDLARINNAQDVISILDKKPTTPKKAPAP